MDNLEAWPCFMFDGILCRHDRCKPEPKTTDDTITINEDSKVEELFILSKQDVENLLSFFMRAGYISYEHDMPIHELIKKMQEYLKEVE